MVRYFLSALVVAAMLMGNCEGVFAESFVGVKIHVINVRAADSILVEYDQPDANSTLCLLMVVMQRNQ